MAIFGILSFIFIFLNNFQNKTIDLSVIRTRIIRVEGKHADHLAPNYKRLLAHLTNLSFFRSRWSEKKMNFFFFYDWSFVGLSNKSDNCSLSFFFLHNDDESVSN